MRAIGALPELVGDGGGARPSVRAAFTGPLSVDPAANRVEDWARAGAEGLHEEPALHDFSVHGQRVIWPYELRRALSDGKAGKVLRMKKGKREGAGWLDDDNLKCGKNCKLHFYEVQIAAVGLHDTAGNTWGQLSVHLPCWLAHS